MSTSPQIDAYERWAPSYAPTPHNPLMAGEQRAMLECWPEVTGKNALDLACGTGRYAMLLQQRRAQRVVALDSSAAMLRQAPLGNRILADMLRLPLRDGLFDIVTSGLAIGHATDLVRWMREVARVMTSGGVLLYSDFHPEAARAGLTRSFKDESSRNRTVPHHRHDVDAQCEAAAAASLSVEVIRELRVGLEFQEDFPESEAFYRKWRGLPLVLVVRARK
jgi:ubiquinone/menaquinone biosynthesis C-methylase UbiE